MARHESDREDLYEELHLAHPRWEIRRGNGVEGRGGDGDSLSVAAVREAGRFVLYLSPDEMFQFDSEARLLRSYRHGFLFRTQGTTLSRLQRHRTESTSELLRHDLTPEELSGYLHELAQSLRLLLSELGSGEAVIVRTSLLDASSTEFLCHQLERCLAAGPCLAPPYPTRRK